MPVEGPTDLTHRPHCAVTTRLAELEIMEMGAGSMKTARTMTIICEYG